MAVVEASVGQLFLTLEYATAKRPLIPYKTSLEDALDRMEEMVPVIACVALSAMILEVIERVK